MTITNINNKSVTITGPKQLRCYQVRVYFVETGVEKVESQKSKIESRKILHKGQLFILRDGNLVDYYEKDETMRPITCIYPDQKKPGWIYYGTEDDGRPAHEHQRGRDLEPGDR